MIIADPLMLDDPAATAAFGAMLGALVVPGDVITLAGPLGAGKTSIARAVLSALGLQSEAPSPTFAIVQPYDPPETRLPVRHVDLYRLESAAELSELGLDEDGAGSVMLIEWPDRAGTGYWPQALALTLSMSPDSARALTASVPAGWRARWPFP